MTKILIDKETVELALEALENATHFIEEYAANKYIFAHHSAITALRQALEKSTEQEPEIWGCKFNKSNRLNTFYTKSAAERYVKGSLQNGADVSLVGLYTTPPQPQEAAPRKPLTDEQIESLKTQFGLNAERLGRPIDDTRLSKFARAIEAAHGING